MYLDHLEVEGFTDNSRVVATITGHFGGETDEEIKLGGVELTLAQWDALRDWAQLLELGTEPSDELDVGPIRMVSL